ncbi:MAG TPA: CDF family Co(II)/Ni(II) efflux transporter DmeF [Candidatus Acidoferrum sp.]|jgi:cation diffusion facilitator family transporter|nr:CDF family Co(II)/Ni(II) efflux transporter DmeF [Candidatus Acidoferrum sp.]
MHLTDTSRWQHTHDFCSEFSAAEKNTRRVLLLTAFMMVAEIVGGWKLHSMALLADGCHMGTHVAAFLITVGAYWFARRHASDARYSFGTGKVAVLGAFTSAIVLAAVALFMAGESLNRLLHPLPIHFNEALVVASLGLAVNVVSAWLLKDCHGHSGHHSDGHHHHDLNLKAAYLHVLADAVTSLLAIAALTGGKFFGWTWLDPVMGLVGSGVIAQWAYALVRDTNAILLDKEPETSDLNLEIRKAIEADGDTRITDLHIWQVGVTKFAAIISVVAHCPNSPADYKDLLNEHEELVHLTVEVQTCEVVESSRIQ